MGLFGNQVMRLVRSDWGGGYTLMLAQELYALLDGSQPLTITNDVTFGGATTPGVDSGRNNVTFNSNVTNNGPVTNTNTVTHQGAVYYEGPVYYVTNEGPIQQTPNDNPQQQSVSLFIGEITTGTYPYKFKMFGANDTFVDPPTYTVEIPAMDQMPIAVGTIIAPIWYTGGTYYGAAPAIHSFYGTVQSGGPSTYTISVRPDGSASRTQTVTASVVVPGSQSIRPGPCFYPVLKYGNGSGARYIVQHATWYART